MDKETKAVLDELKETVVDKVLDQGKILAKVVKDAELNQKALDKIIAERSAIPVGQQQLKSFNQLLAESLQEHSDDIARFARKEKKSFDFQLKAVGDMGFAANFGSAAVSVANMRPGIIENPNRKVHIRDLVPKGVMSGSTFYYMKENGDGEGTVAPVLEGTLKNQVDLDLIEANAPSEFIAGWLRLSTKLLDDVPGMTSYLQNRLLEKYLRAEDTQLISGTGTPPQLSGITDTGNFTAASGAATIDLEQLVMSLSQLEELDREGTGIILRPSDYYSILLNKGATSGDYTLPNVVTVDANGTMRIMGIPVVRSTAMTVDKFIVGDFVAGAMLLIREAPRVESSYHDGTNFRENKVTVRVEGRVAFPIFGSDYFIYGDFGNVV